VPVTSVTARSAKPADWATLLLLNKRIRMIIKPELITDFIALNFTITAYAIAPAAEIKN
jgi:hypothetical protein